MSYQIVEQLHDKAVTVGQLCRMLGVSRSGYYGARQRAKLGQGVRHTLRFREVFRKGAQYARSH